MKVKIEMPNLHEPVKDTEGVFKKAEELVSTLFPENFDAEMTIDSRRYITNNKYAYRGKVAIHFRGDLVAGGKCEIDEMRETETDIYITRVGFEIDRERIAHLVVK
jgi:hypothetical protein